MSKPLTPDDLLEIERRWQAAALATGPADRPAAERAVRELYRRVGWLGSDPDIYWCLSPAECIVFALGSPGSPGLVRAILRQHADPLEWGGCRPDSHLLGATLRDAFLDGLGPARVAGEMIPRRILERIGWVSPVVEKRWERRCERAIARGDVPYLMAPELFRETWAQYVDADWETEDEEDPSEAAPALLTLGSLFLTQFDWGHNAEVEAQLRRGKITGRNPLAVLGRILSAAGAFLPLRGTAVLCERPVAIGLNEEGLLHSATGPALLYPDGWGRYAWWGRLVSRDLWTRLVQPRPLSAAEIDGIADSILRRKLIESTGGMRSHAAALGPERILAAWREPLARRELIEAYGIERFVRDAPATVHYTDEFGTLSSVDVPEDESIVFLKVTNATPEPDGTFRDFCLRVPPRVASPREAVAWTFDVAPHDQYEPVAQT